MKGLCCGAMPASETRMGSTLCRTARSSVADPTGRAAHLRHSLNQRAAARGRCAAGSTARLQRRGKAARAAASSLHGMASRTCAAWRSTAGRAPAASWTGAGRTVWVQALGRVGQHVEGQEDHLGVDLRVRGSCAGRRCLCRRLARTTKHADGRGRQATAGSAPAPGPPRSACSPQRRRGWRRAPAAWSRCWGGVGRRWWVGDGWVGAGGPVAGQRRRKQLGRAGRRRRSKARHRAPTAALAGVNPVRRCRAGSAAVQAQGGVRSPVVRGGGHGADDVGGVDVLRGGSVGGWAGTGMGGVEQPLVAGATGASVPASRPSRRRRRAPPGLRHRHPPISLPAHLDVHVPQPPLDLALEPGARVGLAAGVWVLLRYGCMGGVRRRR